MPARVPAGLPIVPAGLGLLALPITGFSRLALWSVVAVAATGVLNALLTGACPAALLTSTYGALVLAKTAGVLALAALGGWARRRLVPAVTARQPIGVTGWIGVELAVMGAVLGLAAVLAGSAPPAG